MSTTERKNKRNKTVYDVAFMFQGTRYKKRGFATKGDAEAWEINVKHEILATGEYIKPCKKTFLEVYEEAFEIHKSKRQLKYHTICNYRAGINHIKEDKISRMRISNINYKTIQTYFNKISVKYSEGVCNHIVKCFNITFRYAMQNGYIKTDPMLYTECHGYKVNKEKQTISYPDFMKLIEHFENDKPMQIALYIGYYTGARLGETLGFEKSDFDFKNHTVTFNRNLERTTQKLTSLKTTSSHATLPLAKPLEDILIEWFQENPYEPVITYRGSHANYINIANKFTAVGFQFHTLRHTFATNLVASGADIKTTQTLLRHANSQTTLNVYAHADTDNQRKAINQLFTPNLPQSLIN